MFNSTVKSNTSDPQKAFDAKCAILFDRLIDDRCDLYGVRPTISWLIDNDFTKDDLIIRLGFDETDVEHVLANPDEAYGI